MLCFVNTVSVMPSTRRHLARIDDEGALDSCTEEEDAARGVEGRQNVIEFTERCTSREVVGAHGDRLRVRVSSPAEKGRAGT